MSLYTVHWADDALIRIAECAAEPNMHGNVVAAVTTANTALQADGTTHAEHLAEGLWYRDFDALRTYFTINEPANEIEVEMVRLIR